MPNIENVQTNRMAKTKVQDNTHGHRGPVNSGGDDLVGNYNQQQQALRIPKDYYPPGE